MIADHERSSYPNQGAPGASLYLVMRQSVGALTGTITSASLLWACALTGAA